MSAKCRPTTQSQVTKTIQRYQLTYASHRASETRAIGIISNKEAENTMQHSVLFIFKCLLLLGEAEIFRFQDEWPLFSNPGVKPRLSTSTAQITYQKKQPHLAPSEVSVPPVEPLYCVWLAESAIYQHHPHSCYMGLWVPHAPSNPKRDVFEKQLLRHNVPSVVGLITKMHELPYL
jgi:hypothetical protein